MKLHLPVLLRRAIQSFMLAYCVPAVQAANLILESDSAIPTDYSISCLQQNNASLPMEPHGEAVKETLAITTRQDSSDAYKYYDCILFEDISYVSSSSAKACGGAIYGGVTMEENGNVIFSGNSAISSSSAACGGAIGGSLSYTPIILNNNGDVTFSGNKVSGSYATTYGGAIYGECNLSICNNDSVLFEKNAEVKSGAYRLRSIYAGGSGDVISLSAPAGKTIEFRDTIYIDSGSTLKLNADYAYSYRNEDGVFVRVKQQGNIVFTGAYTAEHLAEVKGSAGTVSEILNSQTSIVNTMTNLYGGRLSVEDGAVYEGCGITAMEGSGATVRVKDASLSHSGYNLTFNAGTTLELAGDNTLTGNLEMQEGSILFFDGSEEKGLTVLSGSLTLESGTPYVLDSETSWEGENQILLCVQGGISGDGNLDEISYGSSAFTWVGEVLAWNYNGKPWEVCYKGDKVLTYRDTGGANYLHYHSFISKNNKYTLLFSDWKYYSAFGGAIHGTSSSPITLSYNGNVTFERNRASSSGSYKVSKGGAICGTSSSPVTLSNNGNVTFERNWVSSPDYFSDAYGGAIYGASSSPITMSNNGSVLFKENEASGWLYANGGAIYGDRDSTITLSNNGSVTFSGNTASSSDDDAEGGAIYGGTTLSNNGSVIFEGNMAFSSSDCTHGGAIDGGVTIEENGDVIFSGNTARSISSSSSDDNEAQGGAIDGNGRVTMRKNGDVTFSGNTAISSSSSAKGGAIASGVTMIAGDVMMEENGDVTFSGNKVTGSSATYGGAIYTSGNLSICNNDSVLFEKNAEVCSATYRLRSIYAGGSGDVISLSAPAGKTIEFRDSIYIDSGSTLKLNADYTYSNLEEGVFVRVKQQGDIVFTGAYTAEHLAEVKGSAGTVSEILNSQTSIVNTMTNLYAGRLRVENGAIYQGQGILVEADSGAAVWLRNAQLQHQGYSVSFGKSTTFGLRGCNVAQSDNLSLDGGCSLSFEIAAENLSSAVLTYTGSLTMGECITLNIGAADDSLAHGLYKLLQVTDSVVLENWSNENLLMGSDSYTVSDLEWVDNTLCFNYTGQELSILNDSPYVTPSPEPPDSPESPDEPEVPDTPVDPDEPGIPDTPVTPDDPEIPDTPVTPDKPEQLNPFRPGDSALASSDVDKNTEVLLNGKGSITLEGKVNAGAITVNVDKNLTLKGDKKKGGSLVGEGDLTKKGNGTLTLNDGNSSWTGDTYLEAGTIKVKGSTSLGKGDVYVKGGTLNLGSKAIANDIIQSGTAAIKSGKKFTGTYTLEAGELQKGSTLNINKTATLAGGTVNGTLSGNGTTTVTGSVSLGDKGKITTNALSVTDGGTLTTSAKGLSMNSKVSAVSVKEGSLTLGGKLSAFSLKLDDGTLRTASAKPAALTLKGDVELRNDSDMQINGKLSAIDLDIRDSSLVLSNSSKPQSVTLKGNATLSSATADINGKFTANRLTLDDSSLKLSGSKPQNLTVKQGLSIRNDSELGLNGKLSAAELTLSDSTLNLSNSTKPQSVTVKGNATLSYATADINGKFTANNLKLTNSELRLGGAKPQNLTVKQNLTIGSDSCITLNGKLSAGSLSIQKDGKLTMSGSKPETLKVKGALTLASGSSIILDYDFVQGKTYNLLTFGHYTGSLDFYSIFGVDEDDCTIQKTDKAITMTLTGNWNPQGPRAVSAADTELLPAAAPAVVEANPAADALVQANWGQLEASRAFVNAIANHSMAVQLGSGERAVWASAIGSSSRHSSAGGHAGADTNVSGGAFGLETQVGRASLFGLALGNSWTRVSAHGFGTIEQDTTHLGIYGRSNWRSGIAADWSAAYGRSESETMGSDWSQKHLQLDGRVSYNHELNASTVLSPFAGMQYYASDAATVDGTDTGSLQNLRAEIGVGASHRTGKLGVFGEIAVHQDMARSNPTVSMEGVRYTGMNPGRMGINFTIGASYELSDKWSVNASYTGEFVENANAHSANVGASYKF